MLIICAAVIGGPLNYETGLNAQGNNTCVPSPCNVTACGELNDDWSSAPPYHNIFWCKDVVQPMDRFSLWLAVLSGFPITDILFATTIETNDWASLAGQDSIFFSMATTFFIVRAAMACVTMCISTYLYCGKCGDDNVGSATIAYWIQQAVFAGIYWIGTAVYQSNLIKAYCSVDDINPEGFAASQFFLMVGLGGIYYYPRISTLNSACVRDVLVQPALYIGSTVAAFVVLLGLVCALGICCDIYCTTPSASRVHPTRFARTPV